MTVTKESLESIFSELRESDEFKDFFNPNPSDEIKAIVAAFNSEGGFKKMMMHIMFSGLPQQMLMMAGFAVGFKTGQIWERRAKMDCVLGGLDE